MELPKAAGLFTRDNITLAIAVAGFLLSVYNFVENLVRNRMKIKPSILCTCICESRIFLQVQWVNRSTMPISILSGTLMAKTGVEFPIGKTVVRVYEYMHPENSEKSGEWTARFPIKLDPLSAETFLMEIENCNLPYEDLIADNWKLIVCSSRKNKKYNIAFPKLTESWLDFISRIR